MKPKIWMGILGVLALIAIGVFAFKYTQEPQHLLSQNLQPTTNDCSPIERSFPMTGISFSDETCGSGNTYYSWTYSESATNQIIRYYNGRPVLTMQLFSKNASETPMEVMNNLYDELTSAEKQSCSIQSANGTTDDFSSVATTTGVLTYQIYPTPELIQNIINKYGGLPPEPDYDYLCGKQFGSQFQVASPYFEFISSTPDKYLEVENLPNDGSLLIDLNSIKF